MERKRLVDVLKHIDRRALCGDMTGRADHYVTVTALDLLIWRNALAEALGEPTVRPFCSEEVRHG
ncbi:MAG: hypothetical protein CW346_12085 [Bacillaceae bacterium]|nr:hypothetical protein [Bacillaceae bacterium]